jgi:diguanylate cyclase (GGDEF)-like protein
LFVKVSQFSILLFISILVSHTANGRVIPETPIFSDLSPSEFIELAYTPTFDCPTDALNAEVGLAISSGVLSTQQVLQLTSMKSHGLICSGGFSEAKSILQTLLDDEDADRNAKYYASAIFQLGFVSDTQEKEEACDYYMLARDLAKEKFIDVHLSASLGFISECLNSSFQDRLLNMYTLLEATTKMGNPAALAHAYNRVGYFYGSNGHPSLAANQYKKAFETAKDIYTDENLLNLLGNLTHSLRASGNIEGTKEALLTFAEINQRSGTKQSLTLFHIHEAAYLIDIKDYDGLAESLAGWNSLDWNINNLIYKGLHRWYSAVLCYHNADLQCLRDFIEHENNASSTHKNYFDNSRKYMKFMVDANLMVDDIEGTKLAFASYANTIKQLIEKTQNNNTIFDLTKLHDKITNLEDTLKEQEQQENQIIWGLSSGLLAILLAVLWFARKKLIERKSYDTVTGVLTNTAVVNKLVHLPKPNENCTNALAIFDIANFTEMNLSLGPSQGDYVLEQIANTLKKITRSSDLLGRLGTEQFILCLVNIEENAAQAFFDRAKVALGNTFEKQNHQLAINVDSSMSIYYSTETFDDINEILNNMVWSLSKKTGRQSV